MDGNSAADNKLRLLDILFFVKVPVKTDVQKIIVFWRS
jgi:hypothetical protein